MQTRELETSRLEWEGTTTAITTTELGMRRGSGGPTYSLFLAALT